MGWFGWGSVEVTDEVDLFRCRVDDEHAEEEVLGVVKFYLIVWLEGGKGQLVCCVQAVRESVDFDQILLDRGAGHSCEVYAACQCYSRYISIEQYLIKLDIKWPTDCHRDTVNHFQRKLVTCRCCGIQINSIVIDVDHIIEQGRRQDISQRNIEYISIVDQ